MKKQLLTTSALVAAGMMATAGGASAQTAPASQPIQVTVGGYMYQFVSYVSQDDRSNGSSSSQATLTSKPARVSVNHDAEIWFQGKTTLANGISVALRVELEAATESDQIDEAFAIVEGAFGRIEIGSTDNAAFKTSIHAPEAAVGIGAAGGYNTIIGNLVARPTRSPYLDSPLGSVLPRFFDDDAEKVSYYTPRFEGFQLGLTYTPELTQDRHNLANSFSTGNANAYTRGFAAGLNFTRSFGPIDIAASAGYVTMKKPDSSVQFNNASLSDPKAYSLGAQVGYAGFRFGGSYYKAKDAAVLATNASTGGTGTTGTTVSGATDTWSHGSSFDLGLTYTFGPAVIGASYFSSTNRAFTSTALGNPSDDKIDTYSVSGRYQLGPGVQVQASVFHARIRGAAYTSNLNAAASAPAGINNNKATGVTTGLILNF